ncbi:response regulator [Yokenella regensburgei]|uniref:response regulator n=1 Tax=Yokenella regensburgei TaxID=158877 RepID=UPI002077028B|nr:response regulator [Yokenella regensburgei]
MRILLVEDDVMVGEVLESSLKDAAYAVDWVKNGNDALSGFAAQPYDAVLLDLGLPDKDGFTVLSGVRQKNANVPVLILTARDALPDRLKGLDGGADDYILKPFEMSELLARIRAVIRRQTGSRSPVMSNGMMTLDPTTHEVCLVASKSCFVLSSREYALLAALMMRPGGIFSRRELEDSIYGWGEEVESNAVEFLIHALRKKLGREAIKNIRGVGWQVSKNG